MTHLTYEQLLLTPARLTPAESAHLRACSRCRAEASAWTNLAIAARQADRAADATIAVPAFDSLLGPSLSTVERPSRPRPLSWIRLAAQITVRQTTVLPRVIGPLTLVGLVLAVVAALSAPDPVWGVRLFTMSVTLVVLVGALALCTRRRDPRGELLFTLPVSPGAVFLARLTLVLAVDLAGALAASVLVSMLGLPLGPVGLAAAWLGPSLLSAAVAVVLAVYRSTWLGSLTGTALWLIGSTMTLPRAHRDHAPVGEAVAKVWTTTPWTVVVSIVLLATAIWLTNRPARTLADD